MQGVKYLISGQQSPSQISHGQSIDYFDFSCDMKDEEREKVLLTINLDRDRIERKIFHFSRVSFTLISTIYSFFFNLLLYLLSLHHFPVFLRNHAIYNS